MAQEHPNKLLCSPHTTYYSNLFVIKTTATINGQQPVIAFSENAEPTVNCRYPSTTKRLTLNYHTISSLEGILKKHGIYRVNNSWCELALYFQVSFHSQECMRTLFHSQKDMEIELSTLLSKYLSEEESSSPLTCKVETELFLIIVDAQKKDALVKAVSECNYSECLDIWKESEVFEFGSLFREHKFNPGINDLPTLTQLLLELDEVVKWFSLGLRLGVPESELLKIDEGDRGANQGRVDRCKGALFSWLLRNEELSWSAVVKAVKEIKMLRLAQKIANTHGVPTDWLEQPSLTEDDNGLESLDAARRKKTSLSRRRAQDKQKLSDFSSKVRRMTDERDERRRELGEKKQDLDLYIRIQQEITTPANITDLKEMIARREEEIETLLRKLDKAEKDLCQAREDNKQLTKELQLTTEKLTAQYEKIRYLEKLTDASSQGHLSKQHANTDQENDCLKQKIKEIESIIRDLSSQLKLKEKEAEEKKLEEDQLAQIAVDISDLRVKKEEAKDEKIKAEEELKDVHKNHRVTYCPLPILDMASNSSLYVSSALWPKRVCCSESSFRPPATGNIAAIDFGTTSCSVAYCQQGSTKTHLLKLDRISERVPTSILINTDGQIIDFGRKARMKDAEERAKLYYFNQIKMKLHHDSKVHRNYTVKDLNGKEFLLVEVIAMILKYLKEELLRFVSRDIAGPLKATDFDWVITVPAIWGARGKQMMREAAYKAGLTTNDTTAVINNLTDIERRAGELVKVPMTLDDPPNPHLLSLALEPEVAAIYCKKVAKERGVPCSDSKCYMVVDIGGGTVDITAHKINELGHVDVILPPTGNNWGGTHVNEAFKKFLAELLEDENLLSPQDPETHTVNSALLDEIVNDRFETHKQEFGENGPLDQNAVIRLPYNFVTTYKEKLEGARSQSGGKMWYMGDCLYISCSAMEMFFNPVIEGIKKCIRECMETVASEITAVYLVGGFGGCKYVHDIIKEEVHSWFDDASQCEVFRSDDHELAVVRGALAFRQNPIAIHSRIADATYGVGCSLPFDPQRHQITYRFYDDDRKERCNHLFVPFIKKGEILCADKLLEITFVPLKHNQKQMSFDIYTSKKCNIMYVSDPHGNPLEDIKKDATLTVKMPISHGDKDRRVKLTADFTQTEIQIQAYDVTSGEEVTTIVDFLTETETEFHNIHEPSDDDEPSTGSFDVLY